MADNPSGSPYRRRSWVELVGARGAHGIKGSGISNRWIPNTHLHLKEAQILFGKAKIPDWNGKECSARKFELPPDPPWTWQREKYGDYDFFKILGNVNVKPVTESSAIKWWKNVEPDLIAEREKENAARDRWLECLDLFHNELANSNIIAYILSDDGQRHELGKIIWHNIEARRTLHNGFGLLNDIRGSIILKRNFLEPKAQHQLKSADIFAEQFDLSRFPYLAFLVEAAQKAPILVVGKTSKKVIEAWLEDNWPEELGESTPTKIGYMATLLRRPTDERGGNRRKRPDH